MTFPLKRFGYWDKSLGDRQLLLLKARSKAVSQLIAGVACVMSLAHSAPALADAASPVTVRVVRPQIAILTVARFQPDQSEQQGQAGRPLIDSVNSERAYGIAVTIETGNGAISVDRAPDLVGRPVNLVAYARMRAATAARQGNFRSGTIPSGSPLSAARLTSSFGMRWHPILGRYRPHLGVDLAAPVGAPIFAPSDGVVGRANWAGGYGLLVELEHGGGIASRYGHMSRLGVVPGQRVKKGDVIGYVGSTGRSTGPHLHYEVRVNGKPVNPSLQQPFKY